MARFAVGIATGVKHVVDSLEMEEDRSSDKRLSDFLGESVTELTKEVLYILHIKRI